MEQQRRILHVDFNSFFASVACCLDPALRPHPVAVAGDPASRHGIILAKNEQAKRFGVKTGEALWQARQKCPRLITVKPDYAAYMDFSTRGREIYYQYSDRVESFGLDENWIDVSGTTSTFAQAEKLADEVRCRIRRELGITISVGIASNKVFAKLGSDMKKPDAITLVSPENYREVAWPLPAGDLLYVGRATQARLKRLGISTIGDVAQTPPAFLKEQLGKCGLMLHAFANGRDVSPVQVMGYSAPPKSVGNGTTTPRDLVTDEDIFITICMLCDSVGARLREQKLRARTLSLSIRDTGLNVLTRQERLDKPTHITSELSHAAMALFLAHYPWTTPVRSLTVTASDLVGEDMPLQLSLLSDETGRVRSEALDTAVDQIRKKYGYFAINRAIQYKDPALGRCNAKDTHRVHPVGYLQNGSMGSVIGSVNGKNHV